MEDIHRILDALQHSTKRGVLATIIRVEGSAYRREGACMLLQEDGTRIGLLSGGCLETDLAERAGDMWKAPADETDGDRSDETCSARTLLYDLRPEDDFSWGRGAGCGGIVHVLLEPLNRQWREDLRTLKQYLDRRIPVVSARKMTGDFSVSGCAFVTCGAGQREMFGNWREGIPRSLTDDLASSAPSRQKHGLRYVPELAANVYVQYYRPKPRLIIFGAGPDAEPVAALAARTGFSVTVCDWRPAFCDKERFPDADRLLLGCPAEVVAQVGLTPGDSVVVMTHDFARDKELLRLLRPDLRYTGILGSRNRTMRLLGGADIPAWIRSPVGLPIGADGPEQIAVSIVADLIGALRRSPVEQAVAP